MPCIERHVQEEPAENATRRSLVIAEFYIFPPIFPAHDRAPKPLAKPWYFMHTRTFNAVWLAASAVAFAFMPQWCWGCYEISNH